MGPSRPSWAYLVVLGSYPGPCQSEGPAVDDPALCLRLAPSQGDRDLVLQCWIKDQIQVDMDNFLFAGSLATSNLFILTFFHNANYSC